MKAIHHELVVNHNSLFLLFLLHKCFTVRGIDSLAVFRCAREREIRKSSVKLTKPKKLDEKNKLWWEKERETKRKTKTG